MLPWLDLLDDEEWALLGGLLALLAYDRSLKEEQVSQSLIRMCLQMRWHATYLERTAEPTYIS